MHLTCFKIGGSHLLHDIQPIVIIECKRPLPHSGLLHGPVITESGLGLPSDKQGTLNAEDIQPNEHVRNLYESSELATNTCQCYALYNLSLEPAGTKH